MSQDYLITTGAQSDGALPSFSTSSFSSYEADANLRFMWSGWQFCATTWDCGEIAEIGEVMKSSFAKGFVCGVISTVILMAGFIAVSLFFAKREVVHNLDRMEREHAYATGLRLPAPVLDLLSEPRFFDTTWHPQLVGGDTIDFSASEHPVLFINLWATWCRPCVAELPSIRQLAQKLDEANANVSFLLVTTESMDVVREFLSDYQVGLPVAVATDEIPAALWSEDLPTTFVVDAKGRIVLRHSGAADWASPEAVDFLLGLQAVQNDS